MPPVTYKLSFPCPECGGVLTMSVKSGEGTCPLCHSSITVNLDVHISKADEKLSSERGWNRRAFRRSATTTKPMWQSAHQSAE